jgi:uncharacterized RDD family membrane protein YckC
MTDRRSITVLTPELVRLDLELAEVGARFTAFIVDALAVVLGGLVVTFIVHWLFEALSIGTAIFAATVMLVWFVLRNFYFIGFELGWRGRTPGKKVLGLRVVSATGGALTPDQVYARNLTREFEMFLPLIALTAPQVLLPEAPVWVWVGTMCWTLLLGFLPVVNKRSARLGDIIAGTAVIRDPRQALRHDVSTEATGGGRDDSPGFSFTDEQLDLYGEHELHVLEDVLRRHAENPNHELLDLICDKIARKIRWPEDPRNLDSQGFLRAFYAAQRGKLEHRLVLGERREHKVE